MWRSATVMAYVALAADAAPLVVDRTPVAATVQGQAAQLRIDPAAPSIPVFNPDFAARAGFEAGPFGTRAAIGPVRIAGRSAVVRLDLGRGEFRRRVTWFAAPMEEGADGAIGPGGLPEPRVLVRLAPDTEGDRVSNFPLADWGYSGMGVEAPLGGQVVRISFAPYRAATMATAGAGALLAAAQGGRFVGSVETMPIKLGVRRPVRQMALDRAFALGSLSLQAMLVRTGDFGSTAGIPEVQADADPDEVVITGKAKGRPRLAIEIGADLLEHCVSILFDKPAKRLTLRCRAG